MDLIQLKYFCHAAKTENFSKTAHHFLVPPSNISQTVKRLENELGVALFDRKNNSVVLNALGREFNKKISVALAMINDAKNEICEVTGAMKGEIKLLVGTNRRIVTKVIEEFKKNYPSVSFNIEHGYKDISGEYDVIISDDRTICREYDGRPIIKEDIVLAISKSNPLVLKQAISVSELEKECFVSMNEESSLAKISLDVCRQLGFEPNITIRTDDPYYVRKYVEMNMGVALVPSFSWQNQFDDSVSFKSLGDFKRTTYAFVKKGRYVTKAVKEFVEALCKKCEL